jgi:putative cell wall-binding protein
MVSDTVLAQLDGYDRGGGVRRLAGQDRYATAAAISAASFAPDRPVAYVATGLSFPDALGAVPAAARQGGPVLLVQPGSIPASVRAELTRLRPHRIIVVGSAAVVSNAVLAELGSYHAGGGATRIAGADRYATAAAIAGAAFPGGAPTAYLASGEAFPDALSAGPAAAVRGGPVLLAKANQLPTATGRELDRLRISRLVVVGGPSVVSDAVVLSAQTVAY